MIFRDKLYKQNIIGGTAVFSPVGLFDLGDSVVFDVIKRKYESDNPDEDIIYFNSPIVPQRLKNISPDKFFWADVSMFTQPPNGVICYELYREAEALKEIEWYPESPIAIPTKRSTNRLKSLIGDQYVVLHLRNIRKRPEKNVDVKMAKAVFKYLRSTGRRVILVGNDDPLKGMQVKFDGVVDLRCKLSLHEIVFVLKGAELYTGIDSGVAHLAGACGDMPMVVWGFWDEVYAPKVEPGRLKFLMREESTAEDVNGLLEDSLD